MRAIVVEPMRMPRVEEVGNTLKGLQQAVGGSIEVVPAELGDDALVICNEEGKIMGLPYNRCVYDADGIPYDVIAGTFVLCDENRDGEFVSITPGARGEVHGALQPRDDPQPCRTNHRCDGAVRGFRMTGDSFE